ncbi:helix-turn-helix transcriptional regulator [bacterium AH-315-M10]|nr:helix-turn-helix transcriptional regulator [bacterium AH-315-M10]
MCRPQYEGRPKCPHDAGVEKTTFDPRWDHLRKLLVELRKSAGLTQRGLAEALACPRSFISRIELGQRRVDLLEFFKICQACNVDPAAVSADLMEQFAEKD